MVKIDLFRAGGNRSCRTFMIVLAGLMFIAIVAATGLFSANVAGEEEKTFTVTTGADSGTGSLRDILENLANDGDVITFDASVTTVTLMGEISFNKKNITIDGGSGVVITKAAGSFRLLNSTATGSTLTLKGLTVENGNSSGNGGGVYVAGNVLFVNCIFSNNTGGTGGGVYVAGNSTMIDCTFTDNKANYNGGGAHLYGTSVLINCTFTDNKCDEGGGVYARGFSDMTGCSFVRNESPFGNAGGVSASANIVMKDCSFIENKSYNTGGGIYASGSIVMTGCEFIGNKSLNSNGGAMLAYEGLNATDCIFLNNSAPSAGGGVYARKTAVLTDCVIANNSAKFGGGIYVYYSGCVMALVNCTISGNYTESTSSAAVHSVSVSYIFHTTVTDNTGSGVYAKTSIVELYNSIVAGNEPFQIVNYSDPIIVTVGCLIEGELVPDGTEQITYQDIFGGNTFDLATGMHRVPDGGIAAGGAAVITAADLSATTLTPAQQVMILSALEKDQAGASRSTAAGDRVTCGAVEAAMFTEAEETVTTLVSDINPSKPGETVTFTAKVEGLLSGADAEGWVEFYNGATLLGTAQLVSGEATFSISALSIGTHRIYAEYLGNENFDPSGSELSHTVIQSGQPPKHDYYIKASADLGTTISPSGTMTVQEGGKMTFYFSANKGYSILTVLVDGAPLSSADIANGHHTFYDVRTNHSIEVKSAEGSAIILTVVVAEGKGSVEFSVSGGTFGKYVSPVALPDNSSLVLTASADAGYKFIEWRIGETVFSESEISIDNIASSVYLEVYFAEGDATGSLTGEDSSDHTLWWMVGLLLVISFLLWYVFWYRKRYDVYVLGKTVIAGEQRARRKKEYRFTVEEGNPNVYYCVGEEDPWKLLYPDEDGIYTIPKGEVVNTVYMETRR